LLLEILDDGKEVEEIRAEAAHSLGLIDADDALIELIQNLATDSALMRRDCIRAIAGATDGTEDELIEGLQSDNQDIRLGCALALAESGPETIENVLGETDKIPRDTVAMGLSLVSESEREAVLESVSVDEEVEFASSTISTFFNSWADEYSSDLRYWLRKDDEGKESEKKIQ
jgi:HEAT repeat protein